MSAVMPSFRIIILLAAVVATTPLAIDMYLPALPIMAQALSTSHAAVQQSLSIYLGAYALGMLLFGPLADILGRRPLACFGLAGFATASMFLSVVKSIDSFLFWRAIQAFCGAAATVVVPGIIRHLYQEHTAKGMSYVSMTMMLAPLLAPAVGSAIMVFTDWQFIFTFLASYAIAILLLSWRFLPEIDRKHTRLNYQTFFDGYLQVFRQRKAWPFIAISMFASFSFFTFLTAVALVYISYFGVSEPLFALLFGCNVLSLMLANFINSRLVTRFGPMRMLTMGLVMGLTAATALASFNVMQLGLWYTVASVAPLMASLGLMATNADAMIIMQFPQHSGTATAVIGTLRFGSGALAGVLLGLTYTGTAVPFSVMMLAGILCILCAVIWVRFSRV